MERKHIGLILLGILAVIFIISYLHRSKPFSKSSESPVAYAPISDVKNDSTITEWMLTEKDFTLWRKSALSKQRQRGRDPFQSPFIKPAKSSSRPKTIQLRLEGIVTRDGSRKAIINGRTYSVGDWMSDKKVVEIGSDYVILQSSRRRQVLNLFN